MLPTARVLVVLILILGPPSSFAPAAEPRGAVAIWKDALPVPAASDPDHLAALLREAGFGVSLVNGDELADRAVLDAERFDLLVLPYGELYPAVGAETIRRFLRQGGNLITLGGRCFRRPLYRSPHGWSEKASLKTDAGLPQPIVEPSESLVASLAAALGGGDQPAELTLARDPDAGAAFRLVVPDLQSYKYLPFTTKSTAEYSVVHFRARGDAETRHLCIELNETDGSRWKAVVPLSIEWGTYEVSTGEFVAYATEHRGGEGDYLHPERVRRIAFGFPASLVGTGRRSFEISSIEWRPSNVPPQAIARDAMLFSMSTDLVRAFGSELKHADRGGDVTAFFGSRPFRDV